MKILVTGASGFVGKYACECLADAGHEVVALVRSSGTPIVGARSEIVIPDFEDLSLLAGTLSECDSVIHLAGRAHMLNDTALDPLSEFRRVNVEFTERLIGLAAAAGVKRFIFVSSIGVNGNKNMGRPFSEHDPDAPHDLYAISKMEAERAVKEIAGNAGMEYAIVRPALIFGPDAPGNFRTLLKLAARGYPLPFGRLTATRNLLSVWNMADFLNACVAHPARLHDTFLVADRQTVTLPDIFNHLTLGMKKKQWMLPVPRSALGALFAMLGKSSMLNKLDSELMISSDKAVNLLGWNPPLTTRAGLIRAGEQYASRH